MSTYEENDYFPKLERKKLVLSHMESGDWRAVLNFYDELPNYREPLLVWVRPDLALLQFIETVLIQTLGISKVLSYLRKIIKNI